MLTHIGGAYTFTPSTRKLSPENKQKKNPRAKYIALPTWGYAELEKKKNSNFTLLK